MRLPKLLTLLTSIALLCGCGGSKEPTSPSSNAVTINIVGQNGTQAFSPNPAPFGGQQVVFKNSDSVTHRVALNDGSLDTGDLAPGGSSRAVTLPVAGTNFHCTIHPGMVGSATGQGGTPAPPCEGIYCSGY